MRGLHPLLGVIDALGVSRRFGSTVALQDVSVSVGAGDIHALLGPNGAGKSTLIRILCGLVEPSAGTVRVAGVDAARRPSDVRRAIGFVPSGDRTFYLRLSARENLRFFARLHGFSRTESVRRSASALELVGLDPSSRVAVGLYSHGMQKRLSIARALLGTPRVLLLDEPTHDLDPEGAIVVRELISERARRGGVAVVWATQRVEEIRGFADAVTVLVAGGVRFAGSVPELLTLALPRRHLVHLRNGGHTGTALRRLVGDALDGIATVDASDASGEHCVLELSEGMVLSDALARLMAARVDVLACRDEASDVERAFLTLTRTER